jgi:mRNA interferase MazF
MKRGEIYYIKNDFGQIGHEIKKDRPAIIVSNDGYNEKSGMVTVVYLTRTPREDLLSHVTIRSTGQASEALCEQISTISASRVNRHIGTVTDDEMRRVETAIKIHLAMSVEECKAQSVRNSAQEISAEDRETQRVQNQEKLIRAEAERDTFHGLYDQMLERMMGGYKDVKSVV